MNKSILFLRDYGKINLKLRELMDKSGLNRNQLAKKIDVRFEVVDKWYQNQVEKLDLDILARLCCVLGCQVDELLEYQEGDPEKKIPM